jgi:hypothetical protein
VATATAIPAKTVLPDVELKLSRQEAQFLRDIVSNIGGSPQASRRKHADSIREALQGVGYDSSVQYDARNKSIWDLEGNIWVKPA